MITFNLNYIHFFFFESRSTLTDWLNNISGFTSSETQNQSTSSPPPLAFSFIFYCFIVWLLFFLFFFVFRKEKKGNSVLDFSPQHQGITWTGKTHNKNMNRAALKEYPLEKSSTLFSFCWEKRKGWEEQKWRKNTKNGMFNLLPFA